MKVVCRNIGKDRNTIMFDTNSTSIEIAQAKAMMTCPDDPKAVTPVYQLFVHGAVPYSIYHGTLSMVTKKFDEIVEAEKRSDPFIEININ